MRARPAARLLLVPTVLLALAALAPSARAQMLNDRPSPGALTRPVAEEPAADLAAGSTLRQRLVAALAQIRASWRPQATVSRPVTRPARTAWLRGPAR